MLSTVPSGTGSIVVSFDVLTMLTSGAGEAPALLVLGMDRAVVPALSVMEVMPRSRQFRSIFQGLFGPWPSRVVRPVEITP